MPVFYLWSVSYCVVNLQEGININYFKTQISKYADDFHYYKCN